VVAGVIGRRWHVDWMGMFQELLPVAEREGGIGLSFL
jgi:hypothetical protein